MTPEHRIRLLRLGTRASLLARTQSGQVADALRRGRSAARSSSSRSPPRATCPARRWPRSAAPASSSARCATACSAARSTSRCTRSRTCRPPAEGIALAAVPLREDPRDVVVARDGLTLGELPAGARVGTGSPRRAAQLHALGLGLDVVAIRGNVDTRIRKVTDGRARRRRARPRRAGPPRPARRGHRGARPAADAARPPARGRWRSSAAPPTPTLVERRAHVPSTTRATRAAVTAERAVLAALEAGCSAPVGALAEVAEGDDGDELWVRAVALSPDGAVAVRRSATGPPDDAAGSADGWPPRCWPTARARSSRSERRDLGRAATARRAG